MALITTIVDSINNVLWSYVVIVLLLGLGFYFTLRTRFVQFRYLGEMFRLMTESAGGERSAKKISAFQAFCISAASRVGTGNLAGVAIAITSGGPGAVFWMWLIALVGGASSFVESTLAQIYKVRDGGDNFRGGPAYYMEKALKQRWLGILFAVIMMFTYGFAFNATQANTIASACQKAFNWDPLHIALILVFITALVIFGGVKRVANVSSAVVPVMAGLYVVTALYVVIANINLVPAIFKLIVQSAFGVKQVIGGTMGAAIMYGIKRGLFSNEAGMGSAPNAAATAHTTHPVKQGLIQTLGVFFDTILICSATAFIILTYVALGHTDFGGLSGIQLTQEALAHHIPGAHIFVAICVFLFAWSSVIGNYCLSESNFLFITTKKHFIFLFRIIALVFVLLGSIASLDTVWAFADLFMGLMAVINIVSIALLAGIAVKALKDYDVQRKAGRDPVFTKNSIPEISADITCWD